jgi:hypothetical protein
MTRLTQAKWLEHFSFRFFPFDKLEAANEHLKEPVILARSFVYPDNFDKVIGLAASPVTSLLFADRGTGKTACRVMIDYFCSNGTAPLSLDENGNVQYGYVLSVPYVHLIEVVERYKASKQSQPEAKPDISFHADEILCRAVAAFVALLHREIIFRRAVQGLSENTIYELSRLILGYARYLTTEQFTFLEGLGLTPSAIVQATNDPDFTHNNSITGVPIWFLTWWKGKKPLSTLGNLNEWSKLMVELGIASTYVLVDGVDEIQDTADDPYIAFEYIRPLLTNMSLVDGIPHLRMKCFLPTNIQPIVMANSGSVRLDRIPVIETIAWSPENLSKILRNRIAAARSEEEVINEEFDFNGLCVPGSELEKDLIEACNGNPRYLMNLCALMVESHLKYEQPNVDDPYLLSRLDFQTAVDQLDIKTRRLIHIADPSEYGYQYLQKLIREGESETVEFKQRAFIAAWELKSNPELENTRDVIKLTELSIAKGIAGMMNANGGMMLLGVKDDGRIFGIEKDLLAIKTKNDPDGYNQRLSRLVEVYLGLVNIRFLKTRFVMIDGHMICLIKIEKAYWPVYLKNKVEKKDKDGKPIEQIEFYIRGPSVTRKLSPDDSKQYIEEHWKKNDSSSLQ